VFDNALGVLEVASGELVGHAQKRLVLERISVQDVHILIVLKRSYEQQMRLRIELSTCELRHGGRKVRDGSVETL
jgi:hypothetical protein